MIKSFASASTERIWAGECVRELPLETQNIARRKLRMLNNVTQLLELKVPLNKGVSPRFWLGLQDDYDLEEERRNKESEYERIPTVSV